jgi:tetratricopeptide (TPR) repeat protein
LTERAFVVAGIDDLDRYEGEIATIPVRIPLGIRSFGVNAYAAGPRDQVIEEHDELGHGAGRHEELYYVARGHAAFVLDGEDVDAPRGTFVFVADPAVRRAATAKEPDTTILVLGGVPGQAFEPSPWESWLAALPHHKRGDHAAAIETLREGLVRHPGNPNVLYNLACMESLAGRTDDAIAHLGAAIAADPRAREWAQRDADFDAVRNDPRFPGLAA